MSAGRRIGLVVGWALLLIVAVLWGRGAAYDWLARQSPVESPLLVVEGWLSDDLLRQATGWAESNHVRAIYSTGGPIETGSWLAPWNTVAEMTKARLEAMGLGETFELSAVPSGGVRRGRTRESARALQAELGSEFSAFNLASEGPHTRRSWRAFREVFGPEVQVGSIALTPVEYDGRDWWTCSEGVRSVIGEAIAYGYDLLAGRAAGRE